AAGLGPLASFSYTPADNGSYELFLTASDDDGNIAQLTMTDSQGNVTPKPIPFVVANLAPTILALSGLSGTEGSPMTISANVTDPGLRDTFRYLWTLRQGN